MTEGWFTFTLTPAMSAVCYNIQELDWCLLSTQSARCWRNGRPTSKPNGSHRPCQCWTKFCDLVTLYISTVDPSLEGGLWDNKSFHFTDAVASHFWDNYQSDREHKDRLCSNEKNIMWSDESTSTLFQTGGLDLSQNAFHELFILSQVLKVISFTFPN